MSEHRPVIAGYNPAYSRWIRRIQLALPIVAVCLLVWVFFYTGYSDYKIEPIKKSDLNMPTGVSNQVLSPQFDSVDDKGRPFSMTADRADQDEKNQDLIYLTRPKGTLNLSDIEKISAKSNSGQYFQDEQILQLIDNVTLNHSAGYVLNAKTLDMNLKQYQAYTKQPVDVQSDEGYIEAAGMVADYASGLLVFNGPAKLTIYDRGTGLSLAP